MFNIALLRTFVAVAENGSFTRAGSELFRSQSAISMQVRKLEEELGAPLFTRGMATVELTAPGEVMLSYARQILSLVSEAKSAVANVSNEDVIRFGCIEDYASRLVPGVLLEFWRQNPTFKVVTSIAEPADLAQRLGRDLDLVLMAGVAGGGGKLLRRERLCWVGSEDAPEVARMRPVPLALRPENCLPCQYGRSALDAAGIPWVRAYSASGISSLHAAIADGLAIGVFKRSLVGPGLRILDENDGFPPLPDLDILLKYAPRRGDLPAVTELGRRLSLTLAGDLRVAAN